VLESFVKAYKIKNEPLPFGQLLIEIHVWGEWDNFQKFLGWWELLEEAGLRPFWTEVSRGPKSPIPPPFFFLFRGLMIDTLAKHPPCCLCCCSQCGRGTSVWWLLAS